MGLRFHSSDTVPVTSTLPTWYEDDILDGADLAASVVDLSRPVSFSRQAAPVNGDVIRDLLDPSFIPPAAPLAAGSVLLQTGQALGFDGARFDFSALSFPGATNNVLAPNVLRLPSRVLSQIWGVGAGAVIAAPTVSGGAVNDDAGVAAGGGGYSAADARVIVTGGGGTGAAFAATFSGGVFTGISRTAAGTGYTSAPTLTLIPAAQYFLAFAYMTLPTDSDWANTSGAVCFMTTAESNSGEDVANLFRVQFVNSPTTAGPGISARIPNFAGSALQLNLNIPAASRGQKALVALYQIAGVTQLYVRTAAGGVSTATTNVGSPQRPGNILNFSGNMLDFGLCQPGTPQLGTGGSPGAKNFKIGKVGIEALRVSGRDPLTTLNADWARELSRGVHL